MKVIERRLFTTPADLVELIPASLPDPFTTAALAEAMGRPRWLAPKMTCCLCGAGAIAVLGKEGKGIRYARA